MYLSSAIAAPNKTFGDSEMLSAGSPEPATASEAADTDIILKKVNQRSDIWFEDFNNLPDGVNYHAGQAAWDGEVSGVTGHFEVKNQAYESNNLDTEAKWKSEVINIKYYNNVSIQVDLSSSGALESNEDYVKVYYKLDGGPETLLNNGAKYGSFGQTTASVSGLTGNRLQIIIKVYNDNSAEYTRFDNIKVSADEGSLPANMVWHETFNGLPDFSTSGDQWSRDISGASIGSLGYFEVRQHRFLGRELIGEAKLISESIDISGYTTVDLSVDLSGFGRMESSDYINAYYRLNGGDKILIGGFTGASAPVTVSAEGISGNTVQFIIKASNSWEDERHLIDNMFVVGIPKLEITEITGGTLSCNDPDITIGATANYPNVNYLWSGPNGFSSTSQYPTVSTPGTYTVTVTDPQSQSTSTASIEVSGGGSGVFWREDYTLPDGTSSDSGSTSWSITNSGGGSFEVSGNEFMVVNTGAGKVAKWTSGVIDISGRPDVIISMSARSMALNGGNGLESTGDLNDYLRLYYILDGGSKTLAHEFSGEINGNSSEATTVSSGKLNGSTLQIVIKGRTTATDELYYFDNVELNSVVTATATVDGSLSCSNNSVTISGNSNASEATYSWTGPNGFTANTQVITVNTPGDYTLVVSSAEGCTATATANVEAEVGGSNTVWLEEFNLADGTNSDNGSTSWSTNTPPGTFSVVNGEFVVSGTETTDQGIWTSESIDISQLTDITFSVDVRSSGVEMNTSGTYKDYLKVYYKLDGGEKILAEEIVGSLNSVITISEGTFNGESLQIIIKAKATGTNEFYHFDKVKVTGTSQSGIDATATVNGTLTCSNASVSITGESSQPDVTYSWTGPNNFAADTKVISVNTPGDYTLVVSSAGGCTGTTTATVTQNISPPDVTATVNGELGCSNSSVTLSGSSAVANATYSWEGPGNFSSTLQNPVVTSAGTYLLTVTDPANGCTATQSVTVESGSGNENTIWYEDFSLSDGTNSDNGATSWSVQNSGSGTFSVKGNEFKASFSSANEGIWISGIIDISGINGATISADLRSATASSNDYLESDDYIQVYYKLDGGPETLIFANNGGLNGVNNSTSSISIESEPLNGSTVQVIFMVRNSHSTEKYYFDNIGVTGLGQSAINATATVDGTLTCSNTSVNITGGSSEPDATYSWTGPDNFTANTQVISVSTPGEYTLVVSTNGGCTGTATATVIQNTTPPDVTAFADGELSCSSGSVILNGSSATPNVSYNWTGPGNFNSTLQNVTVNEAGVYTLTVTNPENGCTASQSVTVAAAGTSTIWREDFEDLADGTTTDNGNTSWSIDASGINTGYMEVRNKRFVAHGSGIDSESGRGVWMSEVIDISAFSDVTLSVDIEGEGSLDNGQDYIRIYYKADGGAETLFIDGDKDGSFTSGTVSSPVLNGSTVQIVIRTKSTGDSEFYYYDNITVKGTGQSSLDVTATVNGVLTCNNTSVSITGESSEADVTYSWTGPNNFTADTKVINVSTAGDYTLVVSSGGGCTGTATATVILDNSLPEGVTAINTGPLTCETTNVELIGSTTTSGVSYQWLKSGNIIADTDTLTVSEAGEYTLVVTKESTGCTTTTTTEVGIDYSDPEGVTAINTGPLTCETTSVELIGSTTTSGVSYQWLKSGNIIADTDTLTVSEAGEYTLVVTKESTGCTTTTTTEVGIDYSDPEGVTASNAGPLTCETTSVELTGSTSTTGVTYRWLSSGIEIATTATTTVSAPGEYTLEVTKESTGCTTTTTTEVGIDYSQPEGVTASNNGPLTCETTSVELTGSTSTTGVTYRWLSSGIEIATTATTTVSAPGEYTLEVTKESTGCTTTTTTEVGIDYSQPEGVTASNNGPLTCETTSVELTGSTSTTGVTYRWLSSGIEIATTATTTVSAPGEYTLEVTKESTGCTTTTTTEVGIDYSQPEGVTASNNGPLTCETTSVELTGSTSTAGVTYRWLSSGIEIATTATTTVSAPGEYTLEVTKESTGCTTTTTTEVGIDYSQPEGVTASNNGPLTCETTSVELTGSTSTAGVTYRWLSSGIEIATTATTTVSAPGEYTLEVTKESTGCTTTTTTEVGIDYSQPEGVTASNNGPLTCETTSVELTGSTSTTGVTYRWLFFGSEIATTATTEVNTPGEYVLEVTKESTGCTTTTTTEVGIDYSQPEGVTASNNGPLTCETTSVELTGSTSTTGVTYRWLSSGIEIATTATTTVSAPGEYTLEVTKESTGCTTTTTTEVGIDYSQPEGVTASNAGPLTCETTSVELTGSTSTTGVTYRWLSSGIEIATTATTTVSAPGEYTLEVTKESTGCTTTTTTEVGIDFSQPEGVTASNNGPLTCETTSVELTGSTSTTGVTYRWLSSGIEIATTATTTVSAPGEYTLEVTKESTGCTTTTTTEVGIDYSQPEGVTASNAGPLTCETTSVELTGSTSTTGVTYRWLFFGSEIATTATTAVNTPGEYVLEVTKESTGCTTTTTTEVGIDYSQPEGVTASNNGPLTCETTSVELMASTSTTGVTYRWLFFGSEIATTATTAVNTPGEYVLEVTKESTGCTTTTTTEVGIDYSQPEGVTASNNGPLTCETASVELTGSTSTTGVTYRWLFFGSEIATTATTAVNTPGEYVLEVTKESTGCTTTTTTEVGIDYSQPEGVTASNNGPLTCETTSVELTGSTSTTGVTYRWLFFGSEIATTATTEVNTPGEYVLEVTKESTGCTTTTTTEVGIDYSQPEGVTASNTGPLACAITSVELIGSTTTVGVTYRWLSSGIEIATTATTEVSSPGEYTLEVTKESTGCTTTTTTTVSIGDSQPPVCSINVPSDLPEPFLEHTLTAVPDNDVSYSWSIVGDGWSIISGEDTPELIYRAGQGGTSATFTLTTQNNTTGCSNTCSITLITPDVGRVSVNNRDQSDKSLQLVSNITIASYPNPFTEHAKVEFTSMQDDFVTVMLYNLNGVLVNTVLKSEIKSNETYTVMIDGSDLDPGTYYCVITTKSRVYRKKLLLVRN